MDTEHPEKIGQYDVIGVIGKGAMGKVYKAVQPSLNRIVAIKVLPAEFLEDEDRVERFNREAQAVALLNHPNVVQIIEKDQEGDQLYFVMEYVPGTSLEAVLKQRRLSLPEAIRVFKGVCEGLNAAHRQTIIHRDLSPRNILVSEDLASVKLVDFGISRVETISRDQGTLSTSEFSLGSLHYMAPEQARDMISADHRADIYSLGVLLYEMLTGRVPVGRFNLPSQLNSEVPSEIDPIVLRCLEAEPNDRYPTVARLLTEINRLEDQLRLGLVHEVRGIGSSTSKIFIKSARSRSIRATLVAVGAVFLIGAGLFFGGAFRPSERAAEPLPVAPNAAPIEIVEHERPQDLEPEVDPLAEALAGVQAPEIEDPPSAETSEAQAVSPPTTQRPVTAAQAAPTETSTPDRLTEDFDVARNKLEAGLFDEARQDLESLVADNPRSPVVPKAFLLLGTLHERQKNTEKAQATYVELESRFVDSPAAAEAMYRRSRILRADGSRERLRSARALLGALAQAHSDSPWAAKALLDKAAIEIEAKWAVTDPLLSAQVPAALVTYRDFVLHFPDHPGAEEALWYLGETYHEIKQYERSARAFETLGERFPRTRHDAWWRAGQVYDRRLSQEDRAIAAYENVPKNSRRYSEAQRRINRLTRR